MAKESTFNTEEGIAALSLVRGRYGLKDDSATLWANMPEWEKRSIMETAELFAAADADKAAKESK